MNEDALALAAVLWFESGARRYGHDPARTWSSSSPLGWPIALEIDGGRHLRTVSVVAPRRYRVEGADGALTLQIDDAGEASVRVRRNDSEQTAVYAFAGDTLLLKCGAHDFAVLETLHAPRTAAGAAQATDSELRAPMNGKVVAVLVAEGDRVVKGQRLVVVEAMKMQHEMTARAAGTVARLAVRPGDQVANRQLLVELKIAG